MKNTFQALILLLALIGLAACGGDSSTDSDSDGHSDSGKPDSDADHDDHADDDHDDHAHGDKTDLGKQEVDGFTVEVGIYGSVKAGDEAVLDVEISGKKCQALRCWIGIESGAGSMRAKFDGEDGTYHGHAEVPDPVPAGSAIWLNLEAEDGKRSQTSFKIPN